MSDERVQELIEQLHNKVRALSTSTDWTAILATAARFHHYSASNLLLIMLQRPDATQVAGYQRWQELGRHVRRGEKGIKILAPLKKRIADEESGEDRLVLRGFRIVHVFDITQTEGEALPDLPQPEMLAGEAPEALRVHLVQSIQAEGFVLRFPGPANWTSPANGYTDFSQKVVAIRPELSPAQQAKTLAHELAHVLLHNGSEYAQGCRGLAEVEAESVAYIVCTACGLSTDDYSLPYVTSWAHGDMDLVLATAKRVTEAASQVLSNYQWEEEKEDAQVA